MWKGLNYMKKYIGIIVAEIEEMNAIKNLYWLEVVLGKLMLLELLKF